jgi:hypothetical protein
MLRFDSESELESTALGRSLLRMIRDDDIALPCTDSELPPPVPINPFTAIRERLSAVDIALQGLQPQVHTHTYVF